MLHQLFGTDSKWTSVSLLILLTHLLTWPILRLHSPLLFSTHDWRPNSSICPIPILLLRHDTTAITTDCNRSPTLSPLLELTRFWPGTGTKREVWLLRIWFGLAPMNKLVSLTWLLWALRGFWRSTLNYFTTEGQNNGWIYAFRDNNYTSWIHVCMFTRR